MPYSNTSELPKSVKDRLSPGKQRQWMATFNSIYSRTENEGRAFAGANAAVKKAMGYKNDKRSATVTSKSDTNKATPTMTSVHVPNAGDDEKTRKADFKVGDRVEWNSSGGKAQGVIRQIVTSGTVPGIDGDVKVTGSKDKPAARISVLDDDGKPTDTTVGHKLSTLSSLRKAESYTPPEGAKNAAKRVLRWKEKYGDEVNGMTSVGWRRARQLASGDAVSLDTVKRMAQFARHKKNSKIDPKYRGTPWKDAGYVSWLGWGGDTGVNWAKRISERETEKSFGKSNGARSLYAYRPLLNAEDVISHYKAQGVSTMLLPDDMHVTIAYSKDPILWQDGDIGYLENLRVDSGARMHQILGGKAFTLSFDAPSLVENWVHFRRIGAGYDYPSYQPHVTLTYNAPAEDLIPYSGPLIFGPIQMEEIDPPETIMEKRQVGDDLFTTAAEARAASHGMGLQGTIHVFDTEDGAFYMPGDTHDDYLSAKKRMAGIESEDDEVSEIDDAIERVVRTVMDSVLAKSFTIEADVVKAEQQIAYGWASVVSIDGKELVDKQGHVITSAEMEKMANSFMMSQRVAKEMHTGGSVGEVIHSMPITKQLMETLNLKGDTEGWLIGVKIKDPEVWKRVKDGTLKAFSIGGKGVLTDV